MSIIPFTGKPGHLRPGTEASLFHSDNISGCHPRINSTSAAVLLYANSLFQACARRNQHNEHICLQVMLPIMMGVLNALYLKRVFRGNEDEIPSKTSVMQTFGQLAS